MSDEKLISILAKLEEDLDNSPNTSKTKLKDFIIEYFKEKKIIKKTISNTNINKINVKLSYPNTDSIKITS
jgi:hypothetical protein